jgi:hypothetical protein
MLPPLDYRGFKARTPIPPEDVDYVESSRPGFVEQTIRNCASEMYARLRKRYATPFGRSMGVPDAQGTAPPVVTYLGTPAWGSFELVLTIVVAGDVGTAAFQWSVDGGLTQVSSVASAAVQDGGSGYATAPTVTLSAPDLPWGVQAMATATESAGVVTAVNIIANGSGYLYPPTVTFSGGGGTGADATTTLAPMVLVTAAAVPIPGLGVSAQFVAGPFATDNVYTSGPPAGNVFLRWLTAFATIDVMEARGVNPQDPNIVKWYENRDKAEAKLKEAADTDEGLYDFPTNDDTGSPSAIEFGGELGYSETSPYVGLDVQRETGRREDRQGRGGYGG